MSMSIVLLAASMLSAPHAAASHDYPTQERVKFVLECMALEGGTNYENMYGCSCLLDEIADEMTFDAFVEADSYMRLEGARGERGGIFRSSSDRARNIRDNFRSIREKAKARCFVSPVGETNRDL